MIHLKSLSKEFGGKRVLELVSLDLRIGDFLYVLGGTGAGKSTLLKLMAAEENPNNASQVITDTEIAEYNVIMRLRPINGVYQLCMRALVMISDVSIILLGSEIPVHLQINN